MVRGTNKMIIEINDTGSPYFERAVLYLKDGKSLLTPANSKMMLESEATRCLSNLKIATKTGLLRRSFLAGLWKLAAAAAIGAGITFLVLAL